MASLSPAPTRAADVPPRRSSCRPGFSAAARLAVGSRALPAGGRPARGAAHGRLPARGPLQPRRAPARRTRRNANSTSQKQLAGRRGGGHRVPRQEGGADPPLRRCSGTGRPQERSAETGGCAGEHGRQGPGPPGCGQRRPPGTGPQAQHRLASRPRRGPSERLAGSATGSAGAAGSGMARGPRPTNGRNGSAEGAGD